MKTTTSVTLDNDLLAKIKNMNINLSGSINDFLKSLIAQTSGDLDGINIELEKVKLKRYERELVEVQSKVKAASLNIENYEKHQNIKKEKVLEAERENAEKAKKCLNCGNIINISMAHTFKKGNICRSCYMVAEPKDIINWNETTEKKDNE